MFSPTSGQVQLSCFLVVMQVRSLHTLWLLRAFRLAQAIPQASGALPHGMHNAFQGNGPVRPVRSTLAVHNIGRPQRPVSAQLCRAPINECAIAKDDLILIPWRHTCTRRCLCQSCSPAESSNFPLQLKRSSKQLHPAIFESNTASTVMLHMTTHLQWISRTQQCSSKSRC